MDPFWTEFYEVEKSIIVVVTLASGAQTIRIEALREAPEKYSIRSYIETQVILQPAYPVTDGKLPSTKHTNVWVSYDLPWVASKTAQEAIDRGLSFLSERCA
jgi:hypothetical protein